MEIDTIKNEIIIQPCSPKKLAAVYGVSTKVLRTWLRPHPSLHQKRNRVYDLQQLFEIIELIGLPFPNLGSGLLNDLGGSVECPGADRELLNKATKQ